MDRILPEPMVVPELPAPHPQPAAVGPERTADWEAFYANYRQPGYLPGFAIGSKLGGGAFGLVFKATRQSIGKDYAIKFLKVDDSEVRRAVLLELEQVKYFAQVDHPNLVSIEDRGEVDGIPFIVMAYAGAETLKDRLPGTRPRGRSCCAGSCRPAAGSRRCTNVRWCTSI
ncbi:MAG: protein kinase [Planctomycetes bacterium]|nr:protein kinase [Planctomycetota bacterium]